MVVGGMFNVLEVALKLLKTNQTTYFTKNELKELTGLSTQAVTNNIVRLEKAGFLEREEYLVPGSQGRFTRYKLKCGDLHELMGIYFN